MTLFQIRDTFYPAKPSRTLKHDYFSTYTLTTPLIFCICVLLETHIYCRSIRRKKKTTTKWIANFRIYQEPKMFADEIINTDNIFSMMKEQIMRFSNKVRNNVYKRNSGTVLLLSITILFQLMQVPYSWCRQQILYYSPSAIYI